MRMRSAMTGPRDAEITIIGGGAVGAAAAYFLARDGWRDIQLLEGRGLCEATSSQAAGFVGQARPTVERARLTMAAAEVYRNFERETGYTMDYRECGAVRRVGHGAEADRGDGRDHRPAGRIPDRRAAARDLPGARAHEVGPRGAVVADLRLRA